MIFAQFQQLVDVITLSAADVRGSGGLGITLPNPLVGPGQAVAVEAIITGLLVIVVFAVAGDPRNSPSVKGSAPLAIGKHPLSIMFLSPKLFPFQASQ